MDADAAKTAGARSSSASTDRTRTLGRALRDAASRAAERAGGGIALVFAETADNGAGLRLLAAAGLPSPDAARHAARELLDAARDVRGSRRPCELEADASLGERAAGGLRLEPLVCDGRSHGALMVGFPTVPGAREREAITDVAALVALRLESHRASLDTDALRAQPRGHAHADPEGSEEILRLSEALFAQDIELLRNNEKLGKIEKLKNDFIEKMSRELRTPLNSIIESIISVLTGENDALSDNGKAALRAALDDGTAFLRTLQNILDLWRIKQGELRVEIQDVNIREVVDEAIFSVQDAIGDNPVKVEKTLEEPLPKIRTDLAKLSHILFLLLDNAARFTPRGRIEIHTRVESDQLVCQVTDTGIGICPDDQQYIFDEFYQVDDSPKNPGAGLGLTLVRDLVVLLDGEVSIRSEVGEGTTVCFQIPVQVLR